MQSPTLYATDSEVKAPTALHLSGAASLPSEKALGLHELLQAAQCLH
jgi:hypothetical protein